MAMDTEIISFPQQGEIYWADLDPVKGHEQSGFRPVLVVQSNLLNKHLTTVIISPITTNLAAKDLSTTYFLAKNSSHLPSDSIALLYQLRTVDKSRLQTRVWKLNKADIQSIRNQLLIVF